MGLVKGGSGGAGRTSTFLCTVLITSLGTLTSTTCPPDRKSARKGKCLTAKVLNQDLLCAVSPHTHPTLNGRHGVSSCLIEGNFHDAVIVALLVNDLGLWRRAFPLPLPLPLRSRPLPLRSALRSVLRRLLGGRSRQSLPKWGRGWDPVNLGLLDGHLPPANVRTSFIKMSRGIQARTWTI